MCAQDPTEERIPTDVARLVTASFARIGLDTIISGCRRKAWQRESIIKRMAEPSGDLDPKDKAVALLCKALVYAKAKRLLKRAMDDISDLYLTIQSSTIYICNLARNATHAS